MALEIEKLIALNNGYEKTAANQANGTFQVLEYGQRLVKMGEDFLNVAGQAGSRELCAIGNDLVGLGERIGAGLSKVAASSYDAMGDYADIATDLYDVTNIMGAIYNETGNATLGEYVKTAEQITDSLVNELGGNYVAQVYREKRANDGEVIDAEVVSPGVIRRTLGAISRRVGSAYHGTKNTLWNNRGNLGKAGTIAAAAAALAAAGYGTHRYIKRRRGLSNEIEPELVSAI